MQYIQPIDPAPIRHLLDKNQDNALKYVNCLLKAPSSNISVETSRFPTPQIPGTPSNHTPIQKCILTELHELGELERLHPQANQQSRHQFLSNCDWTDSMLCQQKNAFIDDLLFQFNDIFARQRFDMAINSGFKVKLTFLDDRAACS